MRLPAHNSPGHCRSLPPAAGYFAPSHGGTSKSAWGACAWPLPRRLRPQRPRRLRARDIGRGASSLVYAAPISRSLATIQGNLTDDGRKIERAPRGRKVPRAVWRALRREAFASIDACLTQRANYRGCKSAGLASRAESRPSCSMLRCESQLHRSSSQLRLSIEKYLPQKS